MMLCFATCAFGLEALVKEELQRLGLTVTATEDARIFFEADMPGIIKANLWLRCADRVFIHLHTFPAETFAQLFDGMRAMDWKAILPRDAAFTVTGKGALSKLASVRDMQSIGKKAIADAMMAAYGYGRCPETGEAYQVEIGFLRDKATIAINTSGAGLNRRSYRDLSARAPLRETLGAVMVKLAFYHGNETLIDPCCGSGTIAIEAAMIAARIAPGLKRAFAFDGWTDYTQTALAEREQALAARRESGFAHILAYDIDPSMVSMAHRHARRAEVHGMISFEKQDIVDFEPPMDRGVIVVNPPYGQRLEREQGFVVDKALARIRRQKPGFGLYILNGDPTFESVFGQRADKRRKLYNGNTQCQLYMYFRGRNTKGSDSPQLL